jgi:hypothetical protein
MKEIDIPRIEDFIKKLGEKDLIYLNNLIIERLKVLSQIRSSKFMAEFHAGQRISFDGPDGKIKKGFIVRMHKKTVSIRTDEGENWKVAPGFLRNED